MFGFRSVLVGLNVSAWVLLAGLVLGAQWASAQTAPARLVPFRKGSKWGYADRRRRLVLPLRYDEAGPFVDELAWVRQGDRYGYIDGGGNPVTPVHYTRVSNFHRGRATVELNGETFAINGSGQRLPSPAAAEPEEEYLSQGDLTRQDGKVGFRFTVGAAVIPPVYDEIRENYNGLLFVRQGSKWGVVNHKGKLVQPISFDTIRADEATGFLLPLVVREGRYGFLNEEGRLLAEPQYRAAATFVSGVARVETLDGRVGYIDSNGREYFEE